MATKKKTEAPISRAVPRPQAERRVDASPAQSSAPRELTHDAVSRRAFEIWERSGRQPGRELENWLQAETELRGS